MIPRSVYIVLNVLLDFATQFTVSFNSAATRYYDIHKYTSVEILEPLSVLIDSIMGNFMVYLLHRQGI